MKHLTTSILCCLLFFLYYPILANSIVGLCSWQGNLEDSSSKLIYVNINATGANDGSSWADAYNYLQDALEMGIEGDVIWIAAGTYFTDPDKVDTTLSFLITKNLEIYGGFVGTEDDLSERNVMENLTVISGDLQENDTPDSPDGNQSDNATHLFWISPMITNATLIDGLIFQGGSANGEGADNSGGAVYSLGGPVFRDCWFRNNYSTFSGGAVYVVGPTANGIRFLNCRFEQNTSGGFAGGLAAGFLTGEGIFMYQCIVDNNSAERGAGITLLNVNVLLSRCRFESNNAILSSGGVLILDIDDQGYPGGKGLHAIVDSCVIMGNTSIAAGGLDFISQAPDNRLTIRYSLIQNNALIQTSGEVFQYGGGIDVVSYPAARNNAILIDSCVFDNNQSPMVAGGAEIFLEGPDNLLEIKRSAFTNNQAVSGGGLRLFLSETAENSVILMDSSRVSENDGTGLGGGIYSELQASLSKFSIKNCSINDNRASNNGGGINLRILADNTEVEVTGSEFIDNQSNRVGGGFNVLINDGEDHRLTFKKSRFANNEARQLGGGLLVTTFTNPATNNYIEGLISIVDSCTFEQNSSTVGGGFVFSCWSVNDSMVFTNNSVTGNRALDLIPEEFPNSAGANFGTFGYLQGGRPVASGTKILIDNCDFSENQSDQAAGGLTLYTLKSVNQHFKVQNSRFVDNTAGTWGGGLTIHSEGDIRYDIDHCEIMGNSAGERGGGLWLAVNEMGFEAEVSNTIWEDNSSAEGSAIATFFSPIIPSTTIFPEDAVFSVDNSLLVKNTSENSTIWIDDFPGLQFINTTIANNMGDGIHLENNSGLSIQNTMLYNPGFIEYAGPSTEAKITSLGGNLLHDSSMDAYLKSTDLQNTDPLLETDGSFQLSGNSPAVDAGVLPDEVPEFDLAGNPRIVGGGIDIGAFERQMATSISATVVENNFLSLAPNPVQEIMNLSIDNNWRGALSLSIYNAIGQGLFKQRIDKTTDRITMQLNLSHLAAGNYYLVVSDGRYFASKVFLVE